MYVWDGRISRDLPPSIHKINCDAPVEEKQTCITAVLKNADEQLNEACNRILSYFQTRRTAKTLILTPGTSIHLGLFKAKKLLSY